MGERSDVEDALDEVERGRTEAFGRIVQAYALPLRGYLASQVHYLDDVDDLAQEVFLTAFRCLSGYRRGEDFGAWLRGIARNKVLNYFRGSSRRSQALQRWREQVARTVEADLEAATDSDRTEVIERLLLCISRLPERLRCVVRAGLDGSRPADLAKALCTTVGAVYNLHYRANQLLRECLEKEAK
jgi:RNA polymerase sigma-70 factor (ECF subfamily)